MSPFFSIIIPCCNVEPYVKECFQSILNQSFQDWECFAVVETSRDNTERLVRDFAEKDDRIRFFVRPRSGSASIARNTGLDHAHGKYVIFVDGDDYILENSLEKLAEKISSHPDADLYPCAILFHDTRTGKEVVRDNFRADDPVEMTGPEAIRLFQHRSPPGFVTFSNVIRLDFLNQNKLRFVPRMKFEDTELLQRALYLAKRVVPIHELYYFYRIRENSVMTSNFGSGVLLLHCSKRLYNLYVFYRDISKKEVPDPIVTAVWKEWMISIIYGRWFYPWAIHRIPRKRRVCALRHVFQTPDISRFLMENEPFIQKLKVYFMYLSVRHPTCGAWISDLFFLTYYQLVKVRDFIK